MSIPVTKARIALTMPRLSRYGGAESFAWRLSEALARRGHAVDFICSRCETEPPEGVNPVVTGRFGGLRLIKVLWFLIRAERLTRVGGYDLVFGMANTINQDILRIGGGPISIFWQLSKDAWPEGFSRRFKMFRRRLAPVNWLIHWIDARRMRRTPRIVAVSHFVRDLIVKAHPYRAPESIEVIYNRPDLSRFSPPSEEERQALRRAADIGEHEVVIGTAATNFALKGIRQLIEGLPLLPDSHVLHVAGGRNPDRYLRLARQLGVEDRVRFLGRVEDMPSFYRTLDIFVLASFYDACSNAVLEALACGCRVASSARNGSAYFLPEENVFPTPDDVGRMAGVLARMAREPQPGPFVWPEGMETGIEPYVQMIEQAVGVAS
ncbi:glycosyltransferase [Pseudodesulfovibrio cashew]|uniref:Glycosyltransferase n=1 Tax=Pseudodesulfovibrio cashew TaxID=2678688 RepID=A0A6I6JVF6_9BACT|nr:glycosyltransferase family 4 protein [Pseudodesulfovibrio cashew]QGY41674.1 glycosyltransferase [Pseudodesulfovibrio cashew]